MKSIMETSRADSRSLQHVSGYYSKLSQAVAVLRRIIERKALSSYYMILTSIWIQDISRWKSCQGAEHIAYGRLRTCCGKHGQNLWQRYIPDTVQPFSMKTTAFDD